MTIDIRHLRHIMALTEAGSFSRAAEIVGITQPALSRSIASVEASLGIAIFDRTPVGAVPTVVGRQIIDEGRKLLFQMHQLERDAKALADGAGGAIEFGLGPLLASLILPDLLTYLAANLPRLRISTLTSSAVEMLEALSERRIEMCLFAESVDVVGGVSTRKVGFLRIALLARAGHPLANRRNLKLTDLSDFPLANGAYFGKLTTKGYPDPTIVCENFHVLREVALRSNTIWVSSQALGAGTSSPGSGDNLVELDVVDYPPFNVAILLARMEKRTPSPASLRVEAEIEGILHRVHSNAEGLQNTTPGA